MLGRRPDRHRERALLRDGPRQALGPHRARLRRDRRRARPSPAPTRARRRCAQAYERGETDEFIKPTLVGDGGPRSATGDSVIFFNFRPDRARQLTEKLGEAGVLELTTLTEYHEDWDHPVAFPPARPEVTLASTLAERGEAQLHVAETEKYAHVTYFFNGGEEDEYPGEERRLVDSPRDVPTYDKKPEMSAREAATAFVESWRDGDLRLRDHQLRQPGHGGPHRRDRGGGEGGRDRGRVPRPGGGGGARVRRRLHRSPPTTATPTRCSSRTAAPNTAHSMNPVPLIVTTDVGELREGGIARRRGADRPGAAGRGAAGGDDGRASLQSSV